jgi:hypothetical protein
MRFVRQVISYRPRRRLVLLTAVATFFIAAGYIAVGQSSGLVSRDGLSALLDCGFLPREAHQRTSLHELDQSSSSQEPESPTAGLSKHIDSALRRSLAAGSSFARERNGTGSWYLVKSCSSRRIADSSLGLPGARLSTCPRRLHAVVQVSWPMGQSAAESVVLLRRLLI